MSTPTFIRFSVRQRNTGRRPKNVSRVRLAQHYYLKLSTQQLAFPCTTMTTSWKSDWVWFWCLPGRIQFGFSITSCYPRKPQGPVGHWRPPCEALYFLQTRLRGREGRKGTLLTAPKYWRHSDGGREGAGEEAQASLAALSPINQNVPAPSLCLFRSPSSAPTALFSFQKLTEEHDSGACYLKTLAAKTSCCNKSNVFAAQQITNVWEANIISHATVQTGSSAARS